MSAEGTTASTSLQSSFSQIENLLGEAHKVLDRVCQYDGSADKAPDAPAVEGAEPAATQCNRSLARLIERLENIADRVGHL